MRGQDETSGLRAPALSALSVVVYRGPVTLGELAGAEGVRPPTITRVVEGLERAGLVARRADAEDRRVTRVRATARGRALLERARARRVAALAAELGALTAADRATLARAIGIIERIVGPPS